MAVVCLSRLKQWGVIFSMYTSDNDGYFHSREIGTDAGYRRMWHLVYKQMYNDPKMRFCPTAENPSLNTGPFGTWNTTLGSWNPALYPIPGEGDNQTGPFTPTGSYGMNRYVENMKGGTTATDPSFWRKVDAKGGDKVPVLEDCQYSYYSVSATDGPPKINGEYDGGQMRWICIDRHMGFVNAVFLDFSARKVGLKELWTLKHSRTYDTCDKGGWTLCTFGEDRIACHAAWHDAASWMDQMPEY